MTTELFDLLEDCPEFRATVGEMLEELQEGERDD